MGFRIPFIGKRNLVADFLRNAKPVLGIGKHPRSLNSDSLDDDKILQNRQKSISYIDPLYSLGNARDRPELRDLAAELRGKSQNTHSVFVGVKTFFKNIHNLVRNKKTPHALEF